MLIYLAGKDRQRARSVSVVVAAAGHHIDCRWWEDPFRYTPAEERDFIAAADVVIYLWERDQESARYEAGMALALNKPLVVVHSDPQWFLTLPNVTTCPHDDGLVAALAAVCTQPATF